MAEQELIREVEFRQLPGREKYRFGSDGSAYSLRKRGWVRLKLQQNGNGYVQVLLFGGDSRREVRYLHRVILELFVGPCPPGMEACHNNGDRGDNRVENLRWDTRKNNHADKAIHGTLLQGSKMPRSKLTESSIPIIRSLVRAGVRQWQIGERFGVTQNMISRIICGKAWCHVGDDDGPDTECN